MYEAMDMTGLIAMRDDLRSRPIVVNARSLLCWLGIHKGEELHYEPVPGLLWRVCRRCHRTVSLRVLG